MNLQLNEQQLAKLVLGNSSESLPHGHCAILLQLVFSLLTLHCFCRSLQRSFFPSPIQAMFAQLV